MGCNLKSALKDKTTCKLSLAGTGDRAFFFDKADLYGEDGVLPEPGDGGKYAAADFAPLQGKLVAVDIKSNSGQVTSSKTAETEANSQVGTFVCTDNIDGFNELAHALAFIDFGCLIPRVGGGYYVIMSPYKKTTLENNYDSGTTYDSDHGFTVTVTAAPSEYSITTWTPATNVDLLTWCEDETGGNQGGTGS